MKKALSIFLCMLICLPLLAGCTDNGTAENGAETGTEATADTSVGRAEAERHQNRRERYGRLRHRKAG